MVANLCPSAIVRSRSFPPDPIRLPVPIAELMSPILSLHQVTLCYPFAATPAVGQVSFDLPTGDILGLLGPSGCGKTTLLRLIAGFESPQSGTIQIGEQIMARAGCEIPPEHRDVGLVFQDFALFPHLNVRENIRFGLRGMGQRASRNRVQTLIELVGLPGMESRYPHELSGGQQQRVALARALAPKPSLILLDEPLSNLDVQVRLHLRQEIRRVLKETQTSAVFVTHDQEEALAISDWVAVMHQGRLEQWDTPEQIYRFPASRFVAQFVAQANLLPGQLQDHHWQSEVGWLDLSILHPQVTQGELMIRQEELQIELDDQGPMTLQDRQFLGREYRYGLIAPSGLTLQARSSLRFSIGQRVRLSLGSSDGVIFSAERSDP